MDTLNADRRIIRAILNDCASIPSPYETLRSRVVFHVDLIGGKSWVQHDATDRPIALELEAAGVPKSRIVLGFREPKIRPHTGYAVA